MCGRAHALRCPNPTPIYKRSRLKKNQLSARGQARYDKILDVATEIFFEYGFEKCSLNDVVKKAGGSLATLYKYFGNKEGLLLAILERKVDLFYAQFSDCEKLIELSFEEALHYFSVRFLNVLFTEESVKFFRIIVAECQREQNSIGTLFYENAPQKTRELLIKILRHYAQNENIPIDDFEDSADLLLVLLKEPHHFRLLVGYKSAQDLHKEIETITKKAIKRFFFCIGYRSSIETK